MNRLDVGLGTSDGFFVAGREIARSADRSASIPEVFSVTFEDLDDLLALLTPARMAVFRSVQPEPASISAIAERLRREPALVRHDVNALRDAGLLSVESLPDDDAEMHAIVRARAARVDIHVTIE